MLKTRVDLEKEVQETQFEKFILQTIIFLNSSFL